MCVEIFSSEKHVQGHSVICNYIYKNVFYYMTMTYLEWSKSLLFPSNSVAKYDGNLSLLNLSRRSSASMKLDQSTTL